MSQGKYSPVLPNANKDCFNFNCYGNLPVEWDREHYDETTMFANYDEDGFDRYGYSAFHEDGTYVGAGSGIDRLGYTEDEYSHMSEDEFACI